MCIRDSVHSVRDALSGCLRCFIGLKDESQATDPCRKYRSWCERHEDPEGMEAVAGFEDMIKKAFPLSLIHISEPTRLLSISYAVFCLKKKTTIGLQEFIVQEKQP
eukprot:TRINITY_DN66182_c0_g1_i1.p1 TRINITY_DN66182_c0_g1~~TRINITY_DN66182_c0_g1_i1.p1  ORF type:complete len:106 (+),score=31.87 TRINITY_DN66182_c0_g1_i1:100-417(+)